MDKAYPVRLVIETVPWVWYLAVVPLRNSLEQVAYTSDAYKVALHKIGVNCT